MSAANKDKIGNWKPLPEPTNEPVPARGTTRMPYGNAPADVILPIDPHTLRIVPQEEEEDGG